MNYVTKPDPIKNLGKRLVERRQAKELSQRQLGYAIDVTDNTIGNWENGKGELLVWIKRLRELQAKLDCKLEDLLGWAYGNANDPQALPQISVQAKNLGRQLAKERLARDLSQRQLGYAIDVTDNTIGNWENGKGELLVWIKRLWKLSAELGCTLDELLKDALGIAEDFVNPKPVEGELSHSQPEIFEEN